MHNVPAWLTTLAIAAAAVAAIVFTILAIKNKNMKVGVGKEGPFVETKQDERPEAAGSENISHVNVKSPRCARRHSHRPRPAQERVMPVIPAAHPLDEFVDRSHEIKNFRNMLDGGGPSILRISGQGGTGKSSLLSRFMRECKDRNMSWIHLEWRDARRFSHLDIMRRVRQESGKPALFELFNDRVNFYTVPQYTLKIELHGA